MRSCIDDVFYLDDETERLEENRDCCLSGLGALDKATMRHFDASCLAVPKSFAPEQIKRIRESESTVEKWESGVKKPSGMAVKLLTIVQKHGLQMLA
jgi:putative transcriptional regulator